jgi:photosystem II stability/assembly factor-like uncharacterized protein
VAEGKKALIIANAAYRDAALRQLIAPAQDAVALSRVLANPLIGDFKVTTLLDRTSYEIREAVERFFDDCHREQVLLVYYSGHGIKDEDGQLYFAGADTQIVSHRLRRSTAVESAFVDDAMRRCVSRRQVLLLDCCYSGAFGAGRIAKGGNTIDSQERFQGRGRIVLTASDAVQYAFEPDALKGEGVPSYFTQALVRGLETGDADLDQDGLFSLDEIYTYVYDQMIADAHLQRPMKIGQIEGKIFIGRNPHPKAIDLPDELKQAIASMFSQNRLFAVRELGLLLGNANARLAELARGELGKLADDDSRAVSQEAIAFLGGDGGKARTQANPAVQPDVTPAPLRKGDQKTRQSIPAEKEHRREAEIRPEPKKATPPPAANTQVLVKPRGISRKTLLITALGIAVGILAILVQFHADAPTSASLPSKTNVYSGPGRPLDLRAIQFADLNHGWIAAAYGIKGYVFRTSDGGRTWKSSGTAIVPEGLSFLGLNEGMVAGEEGIMATHDGGVTWYMEPDSPRGVHAIQLIAPGPYARAVGNNRLMTRSPEGWTELAQAGRWNSVFFIDPKVGWVAGESGGLLSTLNGDTWQRPVVGPRVQGRTLLGELTTTTVGGLNAVYFVDQLHGWAAGTDGVFATQDGGANWEQQGTKGSVTAIRFVDLKIGTAVGYDSISHTVDGGSVWQELPKSAEKLESVWFIDARHGWACGNEEGLVRTSDGGATWQTMPFEPESDTKPLPGKA